MKRLWDWYSQATGWGQCERCRRPWQFAKERAVDYTPSRGLFALCERCWDQTTPAERVDYYGRLLDRWGSIDEPGITRADILDAVREGKTWRDYWEAA